MKNIGALVRLLLTSSFAGMGLWLQEDAQAQNLFVSSFNNNAIYEITPTGTESTFVTGITDPQAMAFNNAGDLFVQSNGSIIQVTPGGVKSTFATGLTDIGDLACDREGDVFVSNFNVNGSVIEISPGGIKSTFATGLDEPRGLVFNSAGDLFVGTLTNITEITAGGIESNFGSLSDVNHMAIDGAGDLFAETIENQLQAIVEIEANGTRSTFTTAPSDIGQLAFNNAGDLFVANRNGNDVLEFTSNGTPSTFASLSEPEGLAFAAPEPEALGLWGMAAMCLWLRVFGVRNRR